MYYLFNVAEHPQQLFLSSTGKPVFATHSFHIASINGLGAPIYDKEGNLLANCQFVGREFNPDTMKLLDNDKMTPLGAAYCKAMGVEQKADALKLFVKNCRHIKVAERLIKHAEPA